MPLTVCRESPLTPDGRALIGGSQAALRALYSEDECFSLSPEELDTPATDFLIARRGGRALGCVALVDRGDYGEIKRLFVTPGARGTGIAQALMDGAEAAARTRGLALLKLETGPALAAAVALYRGRGYRDCGPFADYPDIASNIFMERSLPQARP